MRERILITDSSGNLIADPEYLAEAISGLGFSSLWPKGFDHCSFRLPRNAVYEIPWDVENRLTVMDGAEELWVGRLTNPQRNMTGGLGDVTLDGYGYYEQFLRKHIRKRWIDKNGINRLEFLGVLNETDGAYVPTWKGMMPIERGENFIVIRFAPDDINFSSTEKPRAVFRYDNPKGAKTRRITLNWDWRSGEWGEIQIWNIDTDSEETQERQKPGGGTKNVITRENTYGSTWDVTFGTAAESWEIRIGPDDNDTYDQNDWVLIRDLVVYAKMDYTGSPAYDYDNDELVKDIIYLAANGIVSADLGQIAAMDYALTNGFETPGDGYVPADMVLQQLVSYGDASQNTYGLSVWGTTRSSDGLPQAEVVARSISSHEWLLKQREADAFTPRDEEGTVENWINVSYIDETGIKRWVTPDMDSSLKNQASIDKYGERQGTLEIGTGDKAAAVAFGRRRLSYHANPLPQCSLRVQGEIRDSNGQVVPTNRIRAGDRVLVEDYQGGTTYFLRQAGFDVDSDTASLSSDVAPDSVAVGLAQLSYWRSWEQPIVDFGKKWGERR